MPLCTFNLQVAEHCSGHSWPFRLASSAGPWRLWRRAPPLPQASLTSSCSGCSCSFSRKGPAARPGAPSTLQASTQGARCALPPPLPADCSPTSGPRPACARTPQRLRGLALHTHVYDAENPDSLVLGKNSNRAYSASDSEKHRKGGFPKAQISASERAPHLASLPSKPPDGTAIHV